MTSESPAVNTSSRSQTPPNHFSSLDASRLEGRGEFWKTEVDTGSSSHHKSDGLLPPFPSAQYSHLPTPQSPSDGDRLVKDAHSAHESPLPQSSQSFGAAAGSLTQRLSQQRSFVEEERVRTPSQTHQFLTPDSSPYVSRVANSRQNNFATPTFHTSPRPLPSPSRMSLESSILNTAPTLNSTFGPSLPHAESPPPASALSSPFMAKASGSDRNKRRDEPTLPGPGGPFPSSTPKEPSSSQPERSSLMQSGGEMERLRHAAREEHLTHTREAEARRPEYLRRTRRAGEPDPNAMVEDDRDRSVGIMETPVKGRRLKLFQETSEESFEESLMAGGYGRYRTADWVRQPQPLSFSGAGLTGAPNVVQKLEAVQEPPTEKELKKRKRLEAFRSTRPEGSSRSRLYPVELEGKGRVLLDIPNELPPVPASPDPSPSKKRASRKKKKAVESPAKAKRNSTEPATTVVADDHVDKPNWPDAEFPWRLRTEERAEAAKAEEEERLKWIEKFLDGDSDDDEEDSVPTDDESGSMSFGADRVPPARMGRGKMVPLLAHPEDPRKSSQIKRMTFPTDPGDARAALLAKRSVRALSYRQQRRQRELNDQEEDAELCICRGTDDGRELVQCDGCHTWYHLHCIGIRDVSELGREEDPWFCRRCIARSPSPSSRPEEMMEVATSEPTFAPTDETPRERSSDTTLYQHSVHDSPNWLPPRMPKTPTRGSQSQGHRRAPSWPDFSRYAPTTPKDQNHPVRIYTQNTPGFDGYGHVHDESPFDPTSTPSRGIRFSGPFSTPKTNVWTRPGPLFHTPSKPSHKLSNRTFGGPGSLSATLDDPGARGMAQVQPLGRLQHGVEDSPVRRNRSKETLARRQLGSPLPRMLEESPVMRAKGKERVHESDRRVQNVEC